MICRFCAQAIGALAGALLLDPCMVPAARSLGDLSGPWQLLVDDQLIARKEHVTRTYHAFEKHPANPLLRAEKPWEGLVYVYGTCLPAEDGSGYRLWYANITRNSGDLNSILYATSPDGLHWDKPSLGLRTRQNGSADNNMFFNRPHGNGIASVIHSPWDPDPNRRYRIVNFDKNGYWAAYSPDGVHLRDAEQNPVFTKFGDVAQFLWDPLLGKYVGYGKTIARVSGLRRRCVSRIVSDTIESWPDPELVLAPDTFDDRWAQGIQRTHFYGLSAFAYQSMYLGLLWIFRATDNEGYFVGPVFAELVTSHDGRRWSRQEGDRIPMLGLGPAGSWDAGQLYTATAPILVDNQLRLYYGAADLEHGGNLDKTRCSIGLATLRKDGFASLDAGSATGVVLTKPLAGVTGSLHLNFRTSSNGVLKAEVLDGAGQVLPGYSRHDCQPMTGDQTDATAFWQQQSSLPTAPSPIRLRFILEQAALYSFSAGDHLQPIEEPGAPPLAALFTFEQGWKDSLDGDGAQRLIRHGDLRITTEPGVAAFGSGCLKIGSEFSPLQTLEIAGTARLGTAFTLAATIRTTNPHPARLFSSTDDRGPIKTTALVFEFDPSGLVLPGLRLTCQGIAADSMPLRFVDNLCHHLAVTCDQGVIRFFLDGAPAGTGTVPGGSPIFMERNLFFGEDAGHGREEQLRGYADDILILGRAITAGQIQTLARHGAEAFFKANPDMR